MNQHRRFYVVRGKATHGRITHKCPTLELALDTLRRFERDAMSDIAIHDPDGAPLTPAALEALAAGLTPAAPVALAGEP